MAKPKQVTINLTPKQRAAIRSLTGEDHASVVFEGTKKALSAKLSPRQALTDLTRGAFGTSDLNQNLQAPKVSTRMTTRSVTRPTLSGTPMGQLTKK